MAQRRSSPGWSAADIPSLVGRRALVTGANSGLGLQTSLQLASHGAAVTMTARDPERGRAAVEKVRELSGSQDVTLAELDLADLASVRRLADEWDGPLDVLVDNAGIMAVPYGRTADGFELQLGTNHLGHFALTGLLLPALRQASGARVVVLSSNAHKFGHMNFDDLQGLHGYRPWTAYGQSKLANLLFVRELDRRLRAAGDDVLAVAAHPGIAATNLAAGLAGWGPVGSAVRGFFARFGQSDAEGALPSLHAATAPDVVGGAYYGPGGRGEGRGAPTRVQPNGHAQDDAVAGRLWEISEELTDVTFPDLPPVEVRS